MYNFQKETFFGIEAWLSLNKKDKLLIFLPSAGTHLDDYKAFIDNIKNSYDLIFVESGYSGLSYKKNLDSVNSNVFTEVFYKHFKELFNNYLKIVVLGQSVGTIHALKLKVKIPGSQLILVSPTITEERFILNPFDRYLLAFLLKTKMGGVLLNLVQGKVLKQIAKKLITHSIPDIIRPIQRAGLTSYLECLYEITKNGVVDAQKIGEETILVIGKNDRFLAKMCRQKLLKGRKNTLLVEANHSVIQNRWQDLIHILKAY